MMDGIVTSAYLEWPPRTKLEAAQHLIEGARSWLYRANDCTSMMATHAINQASRDIERAAGLLPDELAIDAHILVARCDEAVDCAGYPYLENLEESASALLEALGALL